MQERDQLPELLCPAGDWERLETALRFGADAVYLGGGEFGMRAAQAYFTGERLNRAVRLCHARGARLYLTVNTLPRNAEIDRLPAYLQSAEEAGVDACIVTDLGVFMLARRYIPRMELHISTQAGVVNYAAAEELHRMGARRVVLARELSLTEIAEIRRRVSPELELETFVHGAMCMSISGRCLLSDYLTGRDANRGACAQPCRWRYRLVEEKRPGQYFPIGETEEGSYILNAKDLCMLPYLDQLAEAGISSFKIEGRAKSSYYTAVTTNAYRIGLDSYGEARRTGTAWELPGWLKEEITKVSHRQYSTGFYFSGVDEAQNRIGIPGQYPESGGYIRDWDVVALVTGAREGRLYLSQKNRFFAGDALEILEPGRPPVPVTAEDLRDAAGMPLEAASHAEMQLSVACDRAFVPGSIVRMRHMGEEH